MARSLDLRLKDIEDLVAVATDYVVEGKREDAWCALDEASELMAKVMTELED